MSLCTARKWHFERTGLLKVAYLPPSPLALSFPPSYLPPSSPPSALIHMPGIPERGLAVRMAVDRECVARYFVAGQWKPSLRGKTTVDHVLRTIQWRERERVAHLGPDDVLAQARDGYLYVNGTDRVGRPLIYFSPAFQVRQREAWRRRGAGG